MMEDREEETIQRHAIAQFYSETGEPVGPELDLPLDVSPDQLNILINDILQNEEKVPHAFLVGDSTVVDDIGATISQEGIHPEDVVRITFQPQAIFRVRVVTKCMSSLSGHSEAVLCLRFSPDGRSLVSGSGDGTVRLWDLSTQTPIETLKGHRDWVLVVEWSPDGQYFASGSKNGVILIWNKDKPKRPSKPLRGHTKWITGLSWEPVHRSAERKCRRLVSSSKDGTLRIWDVVRNSCEKILGGHVLGVTCVRWGGMGYIYSASQDRSIQVWNAESGTILRKLSGHAHWVNTMALSTDYEIRCAKEWDEAKHEKEHEMLVTGSDDFTLYLWDPIHASKPVQHMTGHQQLVNQVCFSPDGRLIASASFDKAIRLWDGHTGKFKKTLRGHVGAVYQIAFSADSRLLVSGSKDSMLKVFDVQTGKERTTLPGHADEVYAVDWSPTGDFVASGGKDRVLKLWKNA